MMLLSRAQELSPSAFYLLSNPKRNSHLKNSLSSQMHSAITIFHSLSPSFHRHHHQHHNIRRRRFLHTLSLFHSSPSIILSIPRNDSPHFPLSASARTFVEQLAGGTDSAPVEENWGISDQVQGESFVFDASFDSTDLKQLKSPALEVKELDELTEAWRRSKLAWLCKELPGHKTATLTRLLNAQRKWVRQEDVTYVTVHLMRIRENETAFRAYKWMTRQHWFQFDFALATKLADFMGKVRKYTKCREIFNDIINQGKVPCESTFHILTIAYLSSSEPGCLEEACSIYNRMIQLGGYKPRLSLHNSLFKALVSKPGGSTKYYLKQAEFIFHNLETCGLEIHQDVYGGLIWLHSYQDTIDKERIASLRLQMQALGIQESKEVLVSILRACSKEGDVVEAENTWHKLFQCDGSTPSQAYVHKMEVYAKDGQPLKSLEIFRGMKEELGSASVVAYHKVIEVLSKAQEIELTESLMKEFVESGLKPLMPSFIDITDMYLKLDLHDKLESTFSLSVEKCRPNRTICNIYLDSLVKIGNIEKAEAVFNEMVCNSAIGVNARSCNTILRGYLHSEEYLKAEKIHNLMCRKKYELEPALAEKLDYALSLSRKAVQRPIIMKLSKEQREILVGLLLGGLRIESDEERKNHAILFEFYDKIDTHFLLKRHIYDQFHEWLASLSKPDDSGDDMPWQFGTISHSYFGFYAEQFRSKGAPVVPKLIHRWLSPRSLAYWYMFGGYRTSSGDILLKLKGNLEGAERIVKVLKTKSLECKVKKKGRVYWVGFLGSNSIRFWKLVEPYIVDDLREFLEPGGYSSDQRVQNQVISFDGGSDSDAETSDSGDWDVS